LQRFIWKRMERLRLVSSFFIFHSYVPKHLMTQKGAKLKAVSHRKILARRPHNFWLYNELSTSSAQTTTFDHLYLNASHKNDKQWHQRRRIRPTASTRA
jgi:hypothetical protein